MSVSRSMQLVNKSVDSMVSAIELYNKPDFKYREELFCIAAINAWELLLKAKILKDNDNRLVSIYVREFLPTKEGLKSKKWRYRENRAKNKLTIDITKAMGRLKAKNILDEICHENIEALLEFRDNAIHFYNNDTLLAQKVQEVGTATLKSYLTLIYDWFSISLNKYNFYLMPLSFFHPEKVDSTILGQRETAVANMLKYITDKETHYPSTPSNPHNITITIETRMVKASTLDAQSIRVSSDPNAPEFKFSLEDIQKTHPLDYDELTKKMRKRYKDFKLNAKYHELRKILEQNPEHCFHYPLNPKNPDGATKPFFSPKVFEEFDKNYHVIK